MIPVNEVFVEWRADPDYRAAMSANEGAFLLATTRIKVRADAGLTQQQLAERMQTTQAAVARLESGRTRPSTRTLERLAAATGTRLRISFDPVATDKR